MRFKGSRAFEEFWTLLEDESPRGMTIVIAAFFDEKLGDLLGQPKASFDSRINNALALGLLTVHEHDDLHEIRRLRNSFAHNLRAKDFDAAKATHVNSLKTWKVATSQLPVYEQLFSTAKDRLLYVAGVFSVRLNHRAPKASGPLPEPPFLDIAAWPPVTSY